MRASTSRLLKTNLECGGKRDAALDLLSTRMLRDPKRRRCRRTPNLKLGIPIRVLAVNAWAAKEFVLNGGGSSCGKNLFLGDWKG